MELDAVLPLVRRDWPRARLLFETLERFLEPLGTCFVVAPDEDVVALRAVVPRARTQVVAESEVIPEIGWFRGTARLRARFRIVGPPIHGWFVQQLVKLAVAQRVGTPFYLTLDADVLCVRPTGYEDLVRDGRALVQLSPPNHPEWNDDAERVLALPRSDRQYGVTPAVLSRDVVHALARHLETRVDPRLRRVPHGVAASWRSYLLRRLPWTEYALYMTFAEATGLLDRHHVVAGEDAIYANAVWMAGQFEEWDPEAGDAPFTLVQSAARIAPERIAARLASMGTGRSRARRVAGVR